MPLISTKYILYDPYTLYENHLGQLSVRVSLYGTTGPQGIQGSSGIEGRQGIQGLIGNIGPTGPQGIFGPTGSTSSVLISPFSGATGITITHSFGVYPIVQVIDSSNDIIIPLLVHHDSSNQFSVTFDGISSGNIISKG